MGNSVEEKLDKLYRRIPDVTCKGLCQASCGPLGTTKPERLRILSACGRNPKARESDLSCNLLTPEGRCSAYAVRPLVCRLWGVVESMKCPHGCRPERYLTEAEEVTLMADYIALAGPVKLDPLVGLAIATDPSLRRHR